ncbi:putative PLP-dependent transferase [Xenorhabdus bovienii str. Jollieti]|uniref:tRNA-splicing ligase RtcB n=1 Tax=Xenorhabdus bovienii (strain SS-2004) TaxID=406818 RepID=D3UWB8_XENBS|nr:RtcB family protein [Xenorhabdus bovienii]CBJ79627.1 putative PLP-dependent transferase [Xenorhabdus bovienii SS-2004]CDH27755.1 putative PLP-dependent transferase [Xenorhabdus bovienii str. Jollieti]
MSTFTRLQKRLSRQGIETQYENNIYRFNKEQIEAEVLLPESLPLEEKAVQQLLDLASVHVPGSDAKVCRTRATPDFHPGAVAPVGCIVATTEDLVIPAAIGTDINCGMRLLTTGLSYAEANSQKEALIQQLKNTLLMDQRDVPVTPTSFSALFDEGLAAWLQELPQQGVWQQADFKRMHTELNAILSTQAVQAHSRYAPEAFFEHREIIRPASLGTVGSGNHFVELQIVDTILDRHAAYAAGLHEGEVLMMIHTGSRDVGFYIGQRWVDKARALWPVTAKYPSSGLFGLTDEHAQEYFLAMGCAARYAWANRIVLTELVRAAWKQIFGQDKSKLIVDLSHNIIFPEQGMNLHRKGATPARAGELALIPGSMGDYSYLVLGKGNEDWLWSCSHGAGRSIRRQAMRNKVPDLQKNSRLPWQCITLKSDRLREEAPEAYKPITPVIEIQEQAGLIQPVARVRPWITFKA